MNFIKNKQTQQKNYVDLNLMTILKKYTFFVIVESSEKFQ